MNINKHITVRCMWFVQAISMQSISVVMKKKNHVFEPTHTQKL